MTRRNCSRCSCLLPEPDESRAAGERIVCPQCGKVYAIRKEKKRKFVCPGCQKKVIPPDDFDREETFRCPWCQVVVRLTPRTNAAVDLPALPVDSALPSFRAEEAPSVEAAAWYGETMLIDDTPRRLPRYFWQIAGGLLLAVLAGLAILIIKQIEPTSASIRGTVYYGEKPVNCGLITFVPEQGKPISALIQADGGYQVDNVPFTEMRITVVVYPEEMKRLPVMSDQEKHEFFVNWGRKPVTILPTKYVEPHSTPLRFTAKQGNSSHDIRIAEEALPPVEKRQPISEDD